LEVGTQTLPNGLGMGGQLDYFGMFIASDFQRGHSRANPLSTTYQNPPLASGEEFELDCVEVIRVRESQLDEEDLATVGRSKNPSMNRGQVQDFLEMAGITMHAKDAGVERAQDDDD
jgi:hypothetical protein